MTNSTRQIRRKMGQAMAEYGMIEDGDTLLVAVSGGKDSLSLLHLLQENVLRAPVHYSLTALHVDLGTCQSKVKRLSRHFEQAGVPFRMVTSDIGENICGSEDLQESCCFHCSRLRRKLIFDTAREMGIGKVAFGHHRDDMIETCLINMFFAGNISTMLPRQEFFDGKLVLIRPLAYCREEWLHEYARLHRLPVRPEACVEGGPRSRRRRIKTLLAQLEAEDPGLKSTLFRSLANVRPDYMPHGMVHASGPSGRRDDVD